MSETIETQAPAIVLTADQEKAKKAFIQFLNSDDEPAFILEGYAGTGKSTLVSHLMEELPKILKTIKLVSPKSPDYIVQLTATTNKAADALRQISGMDVSTIQSFLGLTVQTDYTTRETKLVLRRYEEKHNYLLFVDEASYVDPALLTYIFKLMKNSKVVFMGDPAQLTPVKSDNTPVFNTKFPRASLTQIVRQAAGNPIVDLSTKFRETVKSGQFFSFQPDGFHIQHLTREEFNKRVIDEFTAKGWHSSDSKILAWTNKRVVEYNNAIHSLNKGGTTDLQSGDYAICNKYYQASKGMSIKTDETVLITHVSAPETRHGVTGKQYTVNHSIRAFCPDRIEDRAALLKKAKANEEYEILEEVDNRWIDLRAMYACTINKSQGSTYDRVFIDLDDLKRCSSGNQIARMLYVAVSRARHQVFFTGDLV